PVTDGAELLTLFQTYDSEAADVSRDLPLLAVLCDSLGDAAPENDRLSYVWLLTHPQPTLSKRILSAVPFFYLRLGGGPRTSPKGVPTPLPMSAALKTGSG